MIKVYKLLSILILLFIYQGFIFAQQADLMQTDLSQVKIDQLSDSQIEALIKKAQENGMTIEQIGDAALARGMSPSEVRKLNARIDKIRTSKESRPDSEKFQDRTREYKYEDEYSITKEKKTLEKKEEETEEEEEEEDIFGSFLVSKKKEKPEEKVFGFSIFNNKKISFEPNLNIPTPKNYLLGPGDEIIIDIWGASQETYKQKISPEGNILINNYGPVYLNGFTIEEANSKLKKELSNIYAGLRLGNTFIKVSLGEVRSIKINIVGDAFVPGTYTLPSLATVFNALYAAGGPSFNGTLRSVKVIRNNKTIANLDFYEYLLKGEQPNNIQLQDQDVVFISPYENRVDIKGEIKRPFLYDVLKNETLKNLIDFAGGFTGKAYTHRIKINRKTGRENRIFDVATQNTDTFHLANGDEIKIDSVLTRFENRVEIKGAVYRPGEFAINNSLTLKKLIDKAEGLRGDAFKTHASIYRTREDYTLEVIPVDISAILNDSLDIELKHDDIVIIPSIFDLKEEYYVNIEGEVRNPGDYPYVANTPVEDLIVRAGGLLESASMARLEVARRVKNANAETTTNQVAEIFQFQIKPNLQLSSEAAAFTLQPFDQVFVRRSPGYEEQSLVTLEGEIIFPGKYSLSNKKERISDLVKRAGGLTPEAFPKGAKLERIVPVDDKLRKLAFDTAKFENKKDSLKLYYELQDSIATIGINLERILPDPGSKYDLILKKGDVLKIPKELQTVRLSGEVLSPVLVRYDKAYGFKRYISNAGGFKSDAKKSKSYIIYANGTMDRTRKIIFFNSYPRVEPGAEIVVPKKPEKKGISTAEAISLGSAISSMALIIVTVINAAK